MDDKREPLDRFGQFLMQYLRDRAINFYDVLARARWKAPSLARLQDDLATLDDRQRDIVRRCVMRSVDTALHDFLFRLQEEADNDGDIQVTAGGVNVGRISDGLHGDLFDWIGKYSAYGTSPDGP